MRFSRRAQIRGIDFSMALIIFMLVMSQILIMTSNLIQTNYEAAQISEENLRIQNSARVIVSTPGVPQNWGTTLTAALPANWNFGLTKGNTNSLDPNKVGRLSDLTNSTYRLTYSDVKQGLNSTLGDKTFALRIKYTINVSITSVVGAGANVNVGGIVTDGGQGLNLSSVWVFGVNSAGVVSSNTQTLANGSFSVALTFGSPPSYARIIAIASYGDISQAMTSTTYINTVTPTVANVTLQETSSISSGLTLGMSVSGASADYNYYALFIPPTASTTSSTADTLSGGTSGSLIIPETGIVVAVVVSQTIDEVGVQSFPTTIDMQPTNIPKTTSNSYTTSALCRGILIIVEFTIWEDA